MVKNCSNCFWNQNSICENTNWKSGDKIEESKEPECGYMRKGSTSPVSWKPKVVVTTAITPTPGKLP